VHSECTIEHQQKRKRKIGKTQRMKRNKGKRQNKAGMGNKNAGRAMSDQVVGQS